MDSDSAEDFELRLASDTYKGPSLKQIREFKKEFEKRLKWRKSNLVNEHLLLQEKRILNEIQHTNYMSTSLSNASYKLDIRRLQAQEVYMHAKNQDFSPPQRNTSLSRMNASSNISNSTFNKNSFVSDSDSDDGFNSLILKAKNPSNSRYNAPKKEEMFQKESSLKSSRPHWNRSLNRPTETKRVALKQIG